METERQTLKDAMQEAWLQELQTHLQAGREVRIVFDGISMLPLIQGADDIIVLKPIGEDEPCKKGDVYLFVVDNHHIIHRLMWVENDGTHCFRGDNCYGYERVTRKQIRARLQRIIHKDGTEIDCDSNEWYRQSRKAVQRRNNKNTLLFFLHRVQGWRGLAVYLAFLLVLMWAPMNGMGIPLNNYVFGLRLDHLLHASVYLLCPWFLWHPMGKRPWRVIGVAILIGCCTESVQWLLPYRGFDINDMAANAIGCIVGLAALLGTRKLFR